MRIPITGGEHLGSLDAFREYVSRGVVDILQPDVANCGGLSTTRRIAGLAQAFHVRVFPHVWGTPVAIAAALHLAATLPSSQATSALAAAVGASHSRSPTELEISRASSSSG